MAFVSPWEKLEKKSLPALICHLENLTLPRVSNTSVFEA